MTGSARTMPDTACVLGVSKRVIFRYTAEAGIQPFSLGFQALPYPVESSERLAPGFACGRLEHPPVSPTLKRRREMTP
jgi:hypothetical protein